MHIDKTGDAIPSGRDIQFHGERFVPTDKERKALRKGDVVEGYIAATYTWFDWFEDADAAMHEEAIEYLAERILTPSDGVEAIVVPSSIEFERLDVFVPYGDDVCARYRIVV